MHSRTRCSATPEGSLIDTERKRRKYRYMDGNLTQRRASLEEKIPDIKKTLAMVAFLRDRRVSKIPCTGDCFLTTEQEGKGKSSDDNEDDVEEGLDEEEDGASKPLTTTFELNDTLYAEAELQDTDTVYLWLGVCNLLGLGVYPLSRSAGKCNAVLQNPRSNCTFEI